MPSITIPIKILDGSGTIVWIITIILIFLSSKNSSGIYNKILIFIFISVLLIFINLLLVSYKELVFIEFLNFIKFGIVTLYIISNGVNLNKLPNMWVLFSKINFIVVIYCLPMVLDNRINYMSFGTIISYSFLGYAYEFIILNKKNSLVFLSVCFILALVLGNRGSILMCSVVFLLFILLKKENLIKKILKITFLLVGINYIINNLFNILYNIESIVSNANINSYAIRKYIMMLESGIVESSSGRDEVFSSAIEIIKTNPLRANGLGYYNYKYDYFYPHNFVLDLLIIFGVIGFILIAIMLIILLLKIINIKYYDSKIFILGLFALIITRLSISSTILNEPIFWMVIGIGFSINSRKILFEKYIPFHN